MSRRGQCWDNALAESFFHTLKTEHVYHERFATKQQARNSVFEWIEVFYNRQRIHSALGFVSPECYERRAA
jgi:putative transposase